MDSQKEKNKFTMLDYYAKYAPSYYKFVIKHYYKSNKSTGIEIK